MEIQFEDSSEGSLQLEDFKQLLRSSLEANKGEEPASPCAPRRASSGTASRDPNKGSQAALRIFKRVATVGSDSSRQSLRAAAIGDSSDPGEAEL